MSSRGLGREQVHEAAWGREWYPHPFASCMMPIAAILAMLAMGLLGFSLWEKSLPGNTTIPAVTGLPLEQAQRALARVGLDVEVVKERETSETVPRGYVISVSPDAGRSVKQGRLVRMLVSAGSAYVRVPQIDQMSQQSARKILAQADLRIANEKYVYDDEIPIDRIIRVNPRVGTRVPRNSTVDLVISRGSEADEYIGLDGDESTADVDTSLRSKVLTIDIPEDEKAPAELRIEVQDDEGTHTVYRETHNPGDTVVYTVQGVGDTKAQVFFGSKLLRTVQF